MRSYHGLELAAPTGAVWRWIGCATVHRRGTDVRVERWEGQCPRCGETVIIRARLGSGLRQQFYSRRFNVPPSDVVAIRLTVPRGRLGPAFELRHCDSKDPSGSDQPGEAASRPASRQRRAAIA